MVKVSAEKRAYIKQWQINNKDKVNKNSRERYAKDKSGFDKSRTKYRKNNPEKHLKTYRITNWKQYGIISNDWDKTYDYYINCTQCEWCDEPFDKSANRCLDHDHDINDDVNIRGVLCRGCNSKDYLGEFYKQEQLW